MQLRAQPAVCPGDPPAPLAATVGLIDKRCGTVYLLKTTLFSSQQNRAHDNEQSARVFAPMSGNAQRRASM
jgi:hypothetical protein